MTAQSVEGYMCAWLPRTEHAPQAIQCYHFCRQDSGAVLEDDDTLY